jgi:hypothetical protein
MQSFREWLKPVVYFGSNLISLTGVVLVTTAAILWIFLLPSSLRGGSGDPYIGILQFMVLPGVFFAGLGLMPLGVWWMKKRNAGQLPEIFPPVDFSNQRFRRMLTFVGVATVLNVIIGAQLLYSAVHHMESVSFCGQTCHTVMKPEFTAYQHSPHARVACVSCHIGPGANWFVKSKISGAWQVISVTFGLYETPIPTPVRDLRPARETCEVCHWPQKFGGNRVRVINHYAEDESNTESKTVLLMRIGGGGGYDGIHGAHMGPGVEIKYAHKDYKREEIPWVEYSRNGEKRMYKGEGYEADGPGNLPVRVMDCIDCHTRPSHTFEVPARALDHAIAEGRISRTLPFVKKVGMEALQGEYTTTEQSEREVPAKFIRYYQENYPEIYASRKAEVERGAQEVLAVFSRNVFPEMKVTWGSYPNHIGHTDFTGCFRCHDERASNVGEKTVTMDCNTCHALLATEEVKPKVLADLGLAPEE